MEKPNILFVVTKLELGGAQKQLLHLLRGLDKQRFNIFLLTAKRGLLLEDFLSVPGVFLKQSAYLERPLNPLKDLLAGWEIFRFIKKHKIQIVHTHSSKAGIVGRFAAKMARVEKVLHTVHGWPFHDFQPALSRIFFIWLERLAARCCHRLIVVSRHDRKKGLHWGIGREDQYVVIPYGVDHEQIFVQEGPVREELGIGKADLVVSTVACLKPQKSPQDFIRLARSIHQELPQTKFILVGDGLLRKNIARLIRAFQLEGSVICTGWRRDVGRILSATDVFVLVSLWEGLPIAVLEAMRAGKPVVATNTGGIEEVIQEGENGYLVRPRDGRALSEKTIRLLKDETLRRFIGQNAAKSLNGHACIYAAVQATARLYEDLLSVPQDAQGAI